MNIYGIRKWYTTIPNDILDVFNININNLLFYNDSY